MSNATAEVLRALNTKFQGTTDENMLQEAIYTQLCKHLGADVVQREAQLGDTKNRIDFLIGRVGVEVKVRGAQMAVLRQLRRYLATDKLDAIVLVTTKLKHATLLRDDPRIFVVYMRAAL